MPGCWKTTKVADESFHWNIFQAYMEPLNQMVAGHTISLYKRTANQIVSQFAYRQWQGQKESMSMIALYMSLEFFYSTHLVGNCWLAECLLIYPFCFFIQFIRAFRNCSNWKVTKLHSLWDVCVSDLILPHTNILLSTSWHVGWGKSSGNSTVRCVKQFYIHHLHSA